MDLPWMRRQARLWIRRTEREPATLRARFSIGLVLSAAISTTGAPVAAAPAAAAAAATVAATVASTHPRQDLRLQAEPAFTVGTESGPVDEIFGRISRVAPLTNGLIAVVDDQELTLTFADREGMVGSRIGGRGDGPGEFQSIGGLWSLADGTVGVWDPRADRMTYLDERGGPVVRTLRPDHSTVEAPGRPDFLVGGLPDGRFVLGWLGFGVETNGVRPDRVILVGYSADGEAGRILGEDFGFVRVEADGFSGPHPLSPYPWGGAGDGTVAFTNGLLAEFTRLDLDAGPTMNASARVPVEGGEGMTLPAAWRQLAPHLSGEGPFMRFARALDRDLGQVPLYGRMIVAADGRIWLKRYAPEFDSVQLRGGHASRGGIWEIYAPDGTAQGAFQSPPDFGLLAIDGELAMGTRWDAAGAPHFAAYRFR